jgi:hypothetical protein
MDHFMLTGEGIEVRYGTTDGVLSVQGDGLRQGKAQIHGWELQQSIRA